MGNYLTMLAYLNLSAIMYVVCLYFVLLIDFAFGRKSEGRKLKKLINNYSLVYWSGIVVYFFYLSFGYSD